MRENGKLTGIKIVLILGWRRIIIQTQTVRFDYKGKLFLKFQTHMQ
jgi:hypothetical protein